MNKISCLVLVFLVLLIPACQETKTDVKDGAVVPQAPPVELKPTEADLVPKLAVSPGGKSIKIVGAATAPSAIVSDTSMGRAVVVSSVPANAICSVVFEAKEDTNKNRPNVLKNDWGKVSEPLKISSKDANGMFIWTGLLKGDACAVAADLPGYLGSTFEELVALPVAKQARFLKTWGTCAADGGTIRCVVPVGDPKALAGEEVFFPAGWAGRNDLNFIKK